MSRAIDASRSAFWRSSVVVVSTAREMPELSLSSETCIATIPPSSAPSAQIQARLRSRRSTTRCSGSARTRANSPVVPVPRRGSAAVAGGRRDHAAVDRSGDAARRARRGRCVRPAMGACRCGRHARTSSSVSLRAARRRADFERGLSATSPGVGATERRNTSSACGVRPQPQTGRSGGQMQPRVRSARKRLTRRSSSEWNEIAASRPPTRSRSHASGSASSSWVSSSLTAMRIAWNVRLAGMAAGEPRGRRDRGRDRVDQLERGGRGRRRAGAARSPWRSGRRSAPRRSRAAAGPGGAAPRC